MRQAWLCATLATVALAAGATCHASPAAAAQDSISPQAQTAGRAAPYLEPQRLIRITGGRAINPADVREQMALFVRDAWVRAHDAYAALSTRRRNQIVADASHDIQNEKPEVVIAAITEVAGIQQQSAGAP